MLYLKIFSLLKHIAILIFHIIIFNLLLCLNASADDGFTLDTNRFVKNEPITSDVMKAAKNINASKNINVSVPKSGSASSYCRKKKRRGIYLTDDEASQNYVTIRGGLMLRYKDCESGDEGRVRIRRNNIYGYYRIKL